MGSSPLRVLTWLVSECGPTLGSPFLNQCLSRRELSHAHGFLKREIMSQGKKATPVCGVSLGLLCLSILSKDLLRRGQGRCMPCP